MSEDNEFEKARLVNRHASEKKPNNYKIKCNQCGEVLVSYSYPGSISWKVYWELYGIAAAHKCPSGTHN
ncbi:hypothetical protein ACFLZK_02645 [Patescibacteria group bacterium]